MSDPNQPRDWSDIDADADPETFVRAMQSVTGLGPVERYKRQSHQLLRPGPGDRILDVGCGPGQDVLMLAELVGEDGLVVGVDNSESMIESARETATDRASVRFEIDDALDLSFDDDSFDAARADRVLQHLESPTAVFRELRRVTRPGGRVAVSDTDFETMFIDTPSGHTEQLLSLEHAPTRNPRMGRQLRRLATAVGLRDVEVFPAVPFGTDYAVLSQAVLLRDWVDAMIDDGVASATEAEDWIEALQAADESDQLFGGVTVITVAGRVPNAN